MEVNIKNEICSLVLQYKLFVKNIHNFIQHFNIILIEKFRATKSAALK